MHIFRKPTTWITIVAAALSVYVMWPVIEGDLEAAPITAIAAITLSAAVVSFGWLSEQLYRRGVLRSPSNGILFITGIMVFTYLILPILGASPLWIAFHFVILPILCAILGIRYFIALLQTRRSYGMLVVVNLICMLTLAATLYEPRWPMLIFGIRFD